MVSEEREVVEVVLEIGGDEGHAMRDGLAHEQAVERVFVVEWEVGEKERRLLGKRQGTDAVPDAGVADVDARVIGETELADGCLDRDLGRGDGTQEDHVARILDGLSSMKGKFRVIGDEPKEVTGIKEEVHDDGRDSENAQCPVEA